LFHNWRKCKITMGIFLYYRINIWQYKWHLPILLIRGLNIRKLFSLDVLHNYLYIVQTRRLKCFLLVNQLFCWNIFEKVAFMRQFFISDIWLIIIYGVMVRNARFELWDINRVRQPIIFWLVIKALFWVWVEIRWIIIRFSL
jgi:hypothetical protein